MLNLILNFLFPQKCFGCGAENEILCEECVGRIDRANPPAAGGVFAASNYSDPILRKTIWLLKYKKTKNAAEPLTRLLRRRVWDKIKLKDAIVIPVPLSKKRFRERGFNQAEEIARRLQKMVLCEMRNDILLKTIHTTSQVSIKDKKRRLDNLKGSFAVKNPEAVTGKNIILIDDVCTTGATIGEAKKVLKSAGAKKVIAIVVARG